MPLVRRLRSIFLTLIDFVSLYFDVRRGKKCENVGKEKRLTSSPEDEGLSGFGVELGGGVGGGRGGGGGEDPQTSS